MVLDFFRSLQYGVHNHRPMLGSHEWKLEGNCKGKAYDDYMAKDRTKI